MTLYGKIIDKTTGAPLPGATVTLQDANGINKGISILSDNRGYFTMNSPIILSTDKLLFTYTEHYPVTVTAQDIFNDMAFNAAEGSLIYLEAKTTTLPDVVVTSTKKSNSGLLIAGGLLLFALADDKKKDKVTGATDTIYKFYKDLPPIAKGILTVGGTAIVYLTLRKLFKKPSPAAAEPQSAAIELQQLNSQGIYPTYSDTQYESFAQVIYNAVDGWGTDEDAIYNVMQSMNNRADVLKLITAFGVREWDDPAVPFQYKSGSLSTALNADLNSSELSHVNSILQSKGINYQFS